MPRPLNDHCYSSNTFRRLAGYAMEALKKDPQNEKLQFDVAALAGLSLHVTSEDVLQVLGYREISHDKIRHDFREAARDVLAVLIDTWHVNRPLRPHEKMTFPVNFSCGFEGRLIFQLDREGDCVSNIDAERRRGAFEVDVSSNLGKNGSDMSVDEIIIDDEKRQ